MHKRGPRTRWVRGGDRLGSGIATWGGVSSGECSGVTVAFLTRGESALANWVRVLAGSSSDIVLDCSRERNPHLQGIAGARGGDTHNLGFGVSKRPSCESEAYDLGVPFLGFRTLDPVVARDGDLRRWRSQYTGTTRIADLQPRLRATVVGVVESMRLEPGRSIEVSVGDGSGRLIAVWRGRTRLPGIDLGGGLRLEGTVAVDGDGDPTMLNPNWVPIAEPYG